MIDENAIQDEIVKFSKDNACPVHGRSEAVVKVSRYGLNQANVRLFTCCNEHGAIIQMELPKILQSYGAELAPPN